MIVSTTNIKAFGHGCLSSHSPILKLSCRTFSVRRTSKMQIHLPLLVAALAAATAALPTKTDAVAMNASAPTKASDPKNSPSRNLALRLASTTVSLIHSCLTNRAYGLIWLTEGKEYGVKGNMPRTSSRRSKARSKRLGIH